MLLQSHEGDIHLLPALPTAWKNGHYSGLVARGNFEISAQWKNGQANEFKVLSKKGNQCILKYAHLSDASLTDAQGKEVAFKVARENPDCISFYTKEGESYTIRLKYGKISATCNKTNRFN